MSEKELLKVQNQPFEIRSGGGLLYTLLGLPILLMGLGLSYAALQEAMQMKGGGTPSPLEWVPNAATCLALVAVGAALVFGRAGKRLDPDRRRLIDWWGTLFFPLHQKARDWDEFNKVVLRKEIVAGQHSIQTLYRVYLEGSGDPCKLESCSTFLESRRLGEKVAKCIKLPLHDLASGSSAVRQPDDLDVSLRDQLLKKGGALELPALPPDARLNFTINDQGAVFELPASGFPTRDALRIAGGALLCLLSFLACFFLLGPQMEKPTVFDKALGFGLLSLFALLFLSNILSVTKAAISRRRITVTHDFLQLNCRSPLGASVAKIPIEQLEELEEVEVLGGLGGRHLEARSDHDTIRIGVGLSSQELSWLKNSIEYLLVKSGD